MTESRWKQQKTKDKDRRNVKIFVIICCTYVFSRNKVSIVFAVAEGHVLKQLTEQLHTHKNSPRSMRFSTGLCTNINIQIV